MPDYALESTSTVYMDGTCVYHLREGGLHKATLILPMDAANQIDQILAECSTR